MSYQVLARRRRPLTFETVVGQGPIVRTLQNALATGRLAHAYLFAGTRGVGKTTTARLLAMGLNCEGPAGQPVPCAACDPCREIVAGRALDVLEIDGASNRGIDEVRALRENTRYAPARGRRKVYIIDEVHMLTEPAFNALLKTLEEPPAHVVFILATTEARELPATILSRCQRFDFRPIGATEIAETLQRIVDEERASRPIAAEADALLIIARAAQGSLRDALSLLDTALAYGDGTVSLQAVRDLLGSGGAEAAWGLVEALLRRDAADALGRIDRAAAEGLDLGTLAIEALEIVRHGLVLRVAGQPGSGLTADETARLAALGAGSVDEEGLLLLVKGLLDTETAMRTSPHPRVELEIAAVRLCHRPAPESIEAILERLAQAEARLRSGGSGGSFAIAPPVVQGDLLAGPSPRSPAPAAPLAAPAAAPIASPGSAPMERGVPTGPAAPAERIPSGAREPTPAPPAPPRPASGPGPATPDAAWREIVAQITRSRPLLGQLLSEGTVAGFEDGRLTVALSRADAFSQDELRRPATRELLMATAQKVGGDVRDVVVTFTGGGSPAAAPAVASPLVQSAVDLFDGEVTEVRPAATRAGARRPA
jgi:DNA polymerase-3 subunit gamma/tau